MALPRKLNLPKVEAPSSALRRPSQTPAPQEQALPGIPEVVPDEAIDGISELEDEVADDTAYANLKPKASRESGLVSKTRLPTQKEKDYVDFILKAGGASTHTVARLHQQSRNSTFRKLKWLKDNGYLSMKEFTYGPPLWFANDETEVYFSAVRHLYGELPRGLERLEHDQIVAYLAAEWIGGLVDSFGFFGGKPADPILAKVAGDTGTKKGAKQVVSQRDYALADAVRRRRLASTCLTKELAHSIGVKKREIQRGYAAQEVQPTAEDIARNFAELKKLALTASGEAHFDVSEATGHAYLHPVSHSAWMAGVPIRAQDSLTGRPKVFEPDAVFYDTRVGRVAVEVERSPKNRGEWWEKLWAYFKHNEEVAAMDIGGKTGGFYYDYIVYVFTDKTTKENFVGMLREARNAAPNPRNVKQKQLVKWLDEHGALIIRDLMVPEANWANDGKLVSYIDRGGVLSL